MKARLHCWRGWPLPAASSEAGCSLPWDLKPGEPRCWKGRPPRQEAGRARRRRPQPPAARPQLLALVNAAGPGATIDGSPLHHHPLLLGIQQHVSLVFDAAGEVVPVGDAALALPPADGACVQGNKEGGLGAALQLGLSPTAGTPAPSSRSGTSGPTHLSHPRPTQQQLSAHGPVQQLLHHGSAAAAAGILPRRVSLCILRVPGSASLCVCAQKESGASVGWVGSSAKGGGVARMQREGRSSRVSLWQRRQHAVACAPCAHPAAPAPPRRSLHQLPASAASRPPPSRTPAPRPPAAQQTRQLRRLPPPPRAAVALPQSLPPPPAAPPARPARSAGAPPPLRQARARLQKEGGKEVHLLFYSLVCRPAFSRCSAMRHRRCSRSPAPLAIPASRARLWDVVERRDCCPCRDCAQTGRSTSTKQS